MPRHITWEVFLEDYIKPGVPAKYQFKGKPDLSFYVADKAKKIGLNISIDQNTCLPDIPLKELTLELKADNDGYYADFSTVNESLFEHFYSMMCFISDSVQIKNRDFIDSVVDAVEQLKNLISSERLLSEEKIIGMWGELWVLEQFLTEKGSEAVNLWKGADKAIHDFRLAGSELEVKTTRNEERIHMISRLSQLEASPDKKLYLCSIQIVEGTSDGYSLAEFVSKIENYLKGDKERLSFFDKQLEKEGYKHSQARFYTTRYYLRSKPEIMIVDEQFPGIYRNLIDASYGKESARISNVHYSIDVTGLGFELNKQEILKLLK